MAADRLYKLRWLFKMAWRDSRRNRSRLFLFGSAIVLGIAAQVAIFSLGENLKQNVDEQAAVLLGADLEISGGRENTEAVKHIIDSVGADVSEERRFSSMTYFPGNKGTRLVQVRALEGNYPYYGKLETNPVDAESSFRNKQAALLDRSLMIQYNVKRGDSVTIGDLNYVVEGALLKAPGQTGISATVAPVVYIPMRFVEKSGLMDKGSRIGFRNYIRLKNTVDPVKLVPVIEQRLELDGFYFDTIETEKQDTGRAFRDLTQYLQLVGFIALLLGCIGVMSAIHIYSREKIGIIAVLRCLGARSSDAFLIFLIQIMVMAAICSALGAALGTGVQFLLPALLSDLIPFEIITSVSWKSIAQGLLLGVVISVLFALVPLVSVRKISPLNTLRMAFQPAGLTRDPLRLIIWGGIIIFLFALMYLQLGNWMKSLAFIAGILVIFLILALVASLIMWLGKRFFPSGWNFVWRQGILNLYRPNNQTRLLIVSIGFGTAFICTLFFIQGILVNRVAMTAAKGQSNLVMYDIQTPQQSEIYRIANQHGFPANPMVPIVSMRLETVNGKRAMDVQEDTTREESMRLFSREYRVTFRDTITDAEKIVEGKWHPAPEQGTGNVYISLEQGFASRFGLKIGDTMVFNVQGALIPTILGSFREVDWNRLQANFLVVFPSGVLEQAPQFMVYMTHAASDTASARFQQEVVQRFPNVSVIDLALVLRILDDVMSKIAFIIRFIAGFSILTGMVVLVISVLISRYQRMQENVLLRTLGASGKQVLTITALEYFFLGTMAAVAGIIVAIGASWALAYYNFETTFTPALTPIMLIFLLICIMTVVIGVLNSRSVLNKPPLEVLRHEV